MSTHMLNPIVREVTGRIRDRSRTERADYLGRMKRHGGRAEIRSELGNGTEVRLFMPTPGWTPAEDKEKIND